MEKQLQLVQQLYGEAVPTSLPDDPALQTEFVTMKAVQERLEHHHHRYQPASATLNAILRAAEDATIETKPSGLTDAEAIAVTELVYGMNILPADEILTSEAHHREYDAMAHTRKVLDAPRERMQPKAQVLQTIRDAARQPDRLTNPSVGARILAFTRRPAARWAIAASFAGPRGATVLFRVVNSGVEQEMSIYEPSPQTRVYAWDEQPVFNSVSYRQKTAYQSSRCDWGSALPLESVTTANHGANPNLNAVPTTR